MSQNGVKMSWRVCRLIIGASDPSLRKLCMWRRRENAAPNMTGMVMTAARGACTVAERLAIISVSLINALSWPPVFRNRRPAPTASEMPVRHRAVENRQKEKCVITSSSRRGNVAHLSSIAVNEIIVSPADEPAAACRKPRIGSCSRPIIVSPTMALLPPPSGSSRHRLILQRSKRNKATRENQCWHRSADGRAATSYRRRRAYSKQARRPMRRYQEATPAPLVVDKETMSSMLAEGKLSRNPCSCRRADRPE